MTKQAKQDKCFHIGIDVAKDKLDIHFLETGEDFQITNSKKEINNFARQHHDKLARSYIVIDSTGGHERLCCKLLHDKGYVVHQAHSYRVKQFIRSMGQEAKTDRLDAIMLASYGRERKENLRVYAPSSENQTRLNRLVIRRDELVKMQTKEKNRLAGPLGSALEKSFRTILKTLEKEIKNIEKQIRACINKEQTLKAKKEVLQSIKGIGETTSHSLLALLPELGELNRKQVAALAGLAPYARDSGNYSGYRSVRGGRPTLRRVFFIAALSAVRFNDDLKTFYQRLRDNGKKPIVALIATARKLATIANARIRDMDVN